jgi:hypothetical protein
VARTKDTTPATYETGPAAAGMAQRLLGHLRHARYLFFFAVLSTLLAAALVMFYGTVQIVGFVVESSATAASATSGAPSCGSRSSRRSTCS